MSKKIFISIFVVLIVAILAVCFLLQTKDNKELPSLKTAIEDAHPMAIRIQNNKCSNVKKDVNITLITDSRYTVPTSIVMYSAIKNKCPNSIYNFYIITENTTPADNDFMMRLKNLAPESVNINLIPRQEPDLPFENMQRFLQYKVGMHKIYLSEILHNVDKVIYMDGDTIVLKDLQELFDIDVNDVYASVAKDGIYYRFPKEMKELGLDKRGFYFNSGVMLHNLANQRKDNIVNKLVEYVKTNEDFYGDQDVLNVVLGDKLKLMSYRYNCISTFFEADDLNFLSDYFGEALPKDTFYIYENSTIIHYAGDKPWQDDYSPIYLKEMWFKYYNEVMAL
ncbi:MAG: glycosyltransferase family 8 protein [Alphaproteobacteria bacterium]|nr:glycosyltransferase family 8 protein [Alphaproteobacteria bacterium]